MTFTFPDLGDTLQKLFVAMVICGAIGIERELRGQSAGFRTHILVGLGSTLLMLISLTMATANPQGDPGRIAAQIVTGIGFLGAGAIIRHQESIHGLTTAASIWGVSAIGMAIGMGWYLGALGTALMILVALSTLKVFEKTLTRTRYVFRIYAAASAKSHDEIQHAIDSLDHRVSVVHWDPPNDEGMQWLSIEVSLARKDQEVTEAIADHFRRCSSVERVET